MLVARVGATAYAAPRRQRRAGEATDSRRCRGAGQMRSVRSGVLDPAPGRPPRRHLSWTRAGRGREACSEARAASARSASCHLLALTARVPRRPQVQLVRRARGAVPDSAGPDRCPIRGLVPPSTPRDIGTGLWVEQLTPGGHRLPDRCAAWHRVSCTRRRDDRPRSICHGAAGAGSGGRGAVAAGRCHLTGSAPRAIVGCPCRLEVARPASRRTGPATIRPWIRMLQRRPPLGSIGCSARRP